MAKYHVLRERVVEHSPSSANHRLSLTSNVPRHTHAWRKILLVRIVEGTKTGLTDLGESEGSGSRRRRDACDVAQQVVLFAHHAEVVVAQSEIDRQALRRTEAVLNIES